MNPSRARRGRGPMRAAGWRRLLHGGVAACAIFLGACASLPPAPPMAASHAWPVDPGSGLGRVAAASHPASAVPGSSGLRVMPAAGYALEARRLLIRRAEHSLDVQYYLFQDDQIGGALADDLRAAAARGVRVRLLVDDLYAAGTEPMLAELANQPGIEVRLFNPLPVRAGSLAARILASGLDFGRVNHRMHNKLLVADGAFAVTGGRNLADEYFMSSPEANFIDVDLLSTGPVVADLEASFDAFWNSRHVWPLQALYAVRDAARRPPRHAAWRGLPDTLPVDPLGAPVLAEEFERGRLQLVWAPARVVADPPDKVDEQESRASIVMQTALDLLHSAHDEVVIVSPYFIPGEVGMPMIRAAAVAGLRFVLVTNALGSSDEPLVHAHYARYRREMLQLGAEIYEISPNRITRDGDFGDFGSSFARLHAKVSAVDRQRLFIGSLNLDSRSATTNTELGMVIESPEIAERLGLLLTRGGFAGMYRLRLAPDRETIEWVSTDVDGREHVTTHEPGVSWWQRFKLWLLAPFAPEHLL